MIQVTHDCTSPRRLLGKSIDSGNVHGSLTTVSADCPSPLPDIIVRATAEPSMEKKLILEPATVRIQLSSDAGRDSVLAVARRGEPCAFSYIDSFE
eukprot:COSAG01_NODE_4773_length_4753_cov_3.688440_8_plen_96_part_00